MKEYLKTGLPILAVFALFMGWLVYEKMNEPTLEEELAMPKTTSNSSSSSVEDDIDNYKRQKYGDPVVSACTWCGGTGKVGFAGESEKQVKRTGAGKGNYCTSCKGTGKIKKYPNE